MVERDVYDDIHKIYLWDEISCFGIRIYERNRMAQYRHVNEYVGKCFENARFLQNQLPNSPKAQKPLITLIKCSHMLTQFLSYLNKEFLIEHKQKWHWNLERCKRVEDANFEKNVSLYWKRNCSKLHNEDHNG